MPPDAQAIENELHKLQLLRNAAQDGAANEAHSAHRRPRNPGNITLAMTATASWNPECNVFNCIRHMEGGQPQRCVEGTFAQSGR